MKRKSIISLLVFCMTLGMMTTSCEDMMTPDSERHSYVVAQDTLYSYWGIIRSLQNIAERYVILNECRGDLVDGSNYVSDSIKAILEFGMNADTEKNYKDGANAYLNVRDYYHIINSCNAYIAYCDTSRMTGISRNPYMKKEYSQVLAIRAWVYMQLTGAYGKVPFYTTPMLTTDDINNFMQEGNTRWITGEELADELAPELEKMYDVEFEFGFPQYNYYGSFVHSSKLMFPVAIVLGDLYLMKGGSQATYAKAANWYFKFLDSKNGGPIQDAEIFSEGFKIVNRDNPSYVRDGNPFAESGAVSKSGEAITLIPSNKGKLDGKVNTDICRLFGWEPSIQVSHVKMDYDDTDDSDQADVEVAFVTLTRNYERELLPSKGYDNLCDEQDFQVYLGDESDPYREILTLEGVGDARRSWTLNGSSQYLFYVGDETYYGKMVSKQCPGGGFNGLYPVLYRKSTIWLRYAEALNRAGFPTYAFAVLKNGLCNNTMWFPSVYAKDYTEEWNYVTGLPVPEAEYVPVDTAYIYRDALLGLTVPAEDEEVITDIETLETVVNQKYQEIADAANAESGAVEGDDNYMLPETFAEEKVWCRAHGFQNYPKEETQAICYYLSREEVIDAKETPYLDYGSTYMRGNRATKAFMSQKSELSSYRNIYGLKISQNVDDRYSMGIHQRGCGILLPLHDEAHMSAYEYVPLVQENIKKNHNVEYSKEDIYNGRNDERVIEAVEDLIVDEMALELAFEGNRFTDLARIATRRGDTDYLAKRVSMRSGTENSSLRSWLQDKNHWYLPLPKE